MGTDGSFVVELKKSIEAPRILEVDGRPHIVGPVGWSVHYPPKPAQPTALSVCTLTGLVDYVRDSHDMDTLDLMVHVVDPCSVDVVGHLEDDEQFRRCHYLSARARVPEFEFDYYSGVEEFRIALQTAFVQTETAKRLQAFVASINDSKVIETNDDSVTQRVSTQRGLKLAAADVPNPVTLAPYRTFNEVEQPESQFVLRAKDGGALDPLPSLALFEADGGAWKLKAIERVVAWLREKLPGAMVIG